MSLRPQIKGPDLAQPAAVDPRLGQASTAPLTPREREVIYWVSEGKRDREIATILGVSPRTVEKHVGHILQKLGVETRTAAVNECRYSVLSQTGIENFYRNTLTNKQLENLTKEQNE